MGTMIRSVPMILRNREEAGKLLANQLLAYKDDPKALILALPRGGVPVGVELSRYLHLPLDVFITRKIGAPGNKEFALGAVAETGFVYMNEEVLRYESASKEFLNRYLDREVKAQKQEISRRQKLYRQGDPLPPLEDRTVLLVDDGVATGSTYLAALHALRNSQVSKIVAAIPVGPLETLQQIRGLVDELVVLHQPSPFQAVGLHYDDFTQVEDEQVCQCLMEARVTFQSYEE
jgi:putative phosphoribosyl transferase